MISWDPPDVKPFQGTNSNADTGAKGDVWVISPRKMDKSVTIIVWSCLICFFPFRRSEKSIWSDGGIVLCMFACCNSEPRRDTIIWFFRWDCYVIPLPLYPFFIPTDFHTFQSGLNHQPVLRFHLFCGGFSRFDHRERTNIFELRGLNKLVMGVPQNRWLFRMENPSINGWELGVPLWFRKPPYR